MYPEAIRKSSREATCWLILTLLLLLTSASSSGQSSSAELTGTVTDESGAPVLGARVVVRNLGTGQSRQFLTDEFGAYLLTQLLPGTYEVSAEKEGFRRFVQGGVVLQIGQRARVDARLPVGSVSESVEVTADATLLEAQEASLSQAIENRKVLDLPVNGRNVLGLAALVPGVVPGTGFGGGVPGGRAAAIQAQAANVLINGGVSAHSDVMMDGVPLALCCQNQVAFIPSIDTTLEFRVQANLYDASYGRTSGGLITYATRNGGNQFQGSAFAFHRNRVLDANNFFSNRQGVQRGHFVYNQFGGRLGGPVVKDRTFFFASYEGIQNRRGSFLAGVVPTASEREGRFSQSIYDPMTTRREGNIFIRDLFAQNQIPSSRIDRVSANLRSLWPAPNATGVNNFISNASAFDKENQYSGRVDHLFRQSHRMFLRYSYNNNDSGLPDWYGNIASPAVFTQQIRNHNAVVDHSVTFSPTLIGSFRYGMTRQSNARKTRSDGTDLTDFGWPLEFSQARQDSSLPQISAAGYLGMSSTGLFRRAVEAHVLTASFQKISGRHSIKFGTDWRVYRENSATNGTSAGSFGFNVGFTRGPNAQTGGGGNSVASFLLGHPASGSIIRQEPNSSPTLYHGLYLQDDIRINDRLTVNVGLRWDVETSRWERYDRLSYFDGQAASPLAGPTGIAGLRGGLRFVGADGNPRKQQDDDWNNLGPRIGFAYTLMPRLVMRGGYGITYIPTLTRYMMPTNPGFAATTPFFSSVDAVTPVGVLSNPFPSGVLTPTGASDGLRSSIGQAFNVAQREVPVGYSQFWSYGIQSEVGSNLLIDVAYSANKGTALPLVQALNQLDPSYLAQGQALLTQVPNPFRPFVTAGTLSAANVTRLQLLRPYPQFLNVTQALAGSGSSSYHSMQLKVNRRLRHGFSVLGSYTIGKLLTDTGPYTAFDTRPDPQNVYDRRGDRALSTQDVAQRLAISYVWEMPFGRGQKFLSDANRVLDAVLGGWQVNGVTTFQGGQPLVITTSIPTSSGATRPNNNGQSAKLEGPVRERLNRYFNTSAFSSPGPFEFGSTPRTLPDVRNHGTNNFDVSLFKNFTISEGKTLQLRGEFFNIFNRVQFAAPIGTQGNANFGTINAQRNNPRNIQVALRFSF